MQFKAVGRGSQGFDGGEEQPWKGEWLEVGRRKGGVKQIDQRHRFPALPHSRCANIPHTLCCRVHGGQGTSRKMLRLDRDKGKGSSLVSRAPLGQNPSGRTKVAVRGLLPATAMADVSLLFVFLVHTEIIEG